ncbi:MAG: translocation/assembly module TamB domain-containing protein [Bacteroidetes bacterium]|nr:translocation/assembly module TamB domain-containing protein [Bacteroidota bacterium]
MLQRITKISFGILLGFFFLVALLWVLLHFSPVQTWLVKKVAREISNTIGAEVEVKKVDFSIFKKIIVDGLLIKDRKKDTLLYAGRLNASFNNWFIFKDKIVINEIGLEHVKGNLFRSDSVWNYQFIIDYFSSPADRKKKKSPVLSLKRIYLNDLELVQNDSWIGEDISIRLHHLQLNARQLSLDKRMIDLKEILLWQPNIRIYNYTGKRPPRQRLNPEAYYRQADTTINPFLKDWSCKADSVVINDGIFTNLLKLTAPVNYFDPDHIQFSSINGKFKNLRLRGDSLLAQLELSTKERSGFQIQELNAAINWHARGMEFHQLRLKTDYSMLTDFFAMRYRDFNYDMNHFISQVVMEGNFKNSRLNTKDIAFFAPALKEVEEKINLSGYIKGILPELKGKNILASAGTRTLLEGDMLLKGLPETDRLYFDIEARRLNSNYADLIHYAPAVKTIKTPDIAKAGNLAFSGNIKGNMQDLSISGNLNTNLGNLTTQLQLKLPARGEPVYEGQLRTDRFEIGQFLAVPQLGTVVMDTKFSGKSFSSSKASLVLEGGIESVSWAGYDYKNMDLSLQLNQNLYEGKVRLQDENAQLELNARVDARGDITACEASGTIGWINFGKTGLFNKDLKFSGKLAADFQYKTIDEFIGHISLRETTLMHGKNSLPFDSLAIFSVATDSLHKKIELHSNVADLVMEGQYALSQIGTIGQKLLSVYFPSYFKTPSQLTETQDFQFEIKTEDIDPFLSLVDLPLKSAYGARIEGSVNTLNNRYLLQSKIPLLDINNVFFRNINIKSDNDLTGMKISGSIESVQLSDSLTIPHTDFSMSGASDTGSIFISTNVSKNLKNAELKTKFSISQDGVQFRFLESDLILGEKIWNITNGSNLFIGSQNIFSDGFILQSGNEFVKLYTHPSEIGAYNDVIIELRKLEIGELLPYFFEDPEIAGSTTGRIDIIDPFGQTNMEVKLSTDKLRINDDSIGLVPMDATYSKITGDIRYRIESDNLGHAFKIKGTTNIAKADSVYTDNLIELADEPLAVIAPYLSGILSDIKGSGTGILRVSGPVKDLNLTGSVRLNNASALLDYTKCRYQINTGAEIEFNQESMVFKNFILQDENERMASFAGKIDHRFFDDMKLDLRFEAINTNKGILVLNTTAKDNSLFYGKVIAYTKGSLKGAVNNLSFKLRGQPTDSSKVFLPTSDSRVTGTASFIVFREYGTDMKPTGKTNEVSSISVDLDLIANPFAKVYLILDEVTNDVIEGQGNGAINLKVGTNEKTSITGNYEITKGKYNFNWQSLFKRPFLINKGTINWSGDPYDARINMDANYIVEQVKLPDELASGCTNERNNIIVVANLSNTLKNPLIKFKFELPQGHPCRNNPLTNNALSQLYSNQDELNRQVISLLLIGSFIASNNNQNTAGGSLGNTFFSSAAGTISEFIAQQVTTGLGSVLSNVPGLRDLRLDPYVTFTPGLISGTQAQGIGFQGTGSFGVTRRLLNGKLLVKAGGSLLLASGQNTTVQNNRQLTPDLSMEWLITPDGKLRLIGFYRSIFDIQRRNDRTGVSFSYIKEFDKIW